jgi:hypothetical protein
MRELVAAVVVVASAFGVVTLVALEGEEVVVIETPTPPGAARRHAHLDGRRDGARGSRRPPERAFVADLRRRPPRARASQARGTLHRPIAPNPDGHDRIRRLLAARYGWADCWIALVADTHASLAIRLACA